MNVLFKEYTEEDYKKTGYSDGSNDRALSIAKKCFLRMFQSNK